MQIDVDDLSRPAIHALLQEHLDHMFELLPPEQVFALDLAGLKVPEITFLSAWEGGRLMGCGALKELSPDHGEIKSMRTPSAARGRGAGRAILRHIIGLARDRGYTTLSLETGTHPAFGAAHGLYRSHGFMAAGPFGRYVPNPHSLFMSLRLATTGTGLPEHAAPSASKGTSDGRQ